MSENPYAAPSTNVESSQFDLGATTGQQSPYGAWRNTKVLALILTILFILYLIFRIVDSIHSYQEISQIEKQGYLYGGDDTSILIEQFGTISLAINIAVALLLVIFWCIWTNKTCKNAWFIRCARGQHLLPGANDTYTPGWSVGWYFVPIAMLWKPFQAMVFIRDSSQMLGGKTMGNTLGLWWTFWIITTVTDRISNRLYKGDGIDSYVTANWFSIYTAPLDLLAGVFALLVVRKLTAIQTEQSQKIQIT